MFEEEPGEWTGDELEREAKPRTAANQGNERNIATPCSLRVRPAPFTVIYGQAAGRDGGPT